MTVFFSFPQYLQPDIEYLTQTLSSSVIPIILSKYFPFLILLCITVAVSNVAELTAYGTKTLGNAERVVTWS